MFPMKTLTAQFQARVEEFLRRTGFKETEFGRQAVSDPTLLLDLRRGRSPKLETADRIQANQQEPHGATADFDLVRLVNAVESQRERWTVSMQFMFLEDIPAELMVFNPMGIIVTYLRGDRALVTDE